MREEVGLRSSLFKRQSESKIDEMESMIIDGMKFNRAERPPAYNPLIQ